METLLMLLKRDIMRAWFQSLRDGNERIANPNWEMSMSMNRQRRKTSGMISYLLDSCTCIADT